MPLRSRLLHDCALPQENAHLPRVATQRLIANAPAENYPGHTSGKTGMGEAET